jgi:hypothetical protein
MNWTDVSVCYGHPEWPTQAKAHALIESMNQNGIGEAWAFGYGAVATHDFDRGNNDIKDLVRQHPDRFVPIGLVNPFHAFPAVDKLLDDGFKSIKILTGWGNWLTMGNVRRVVVPIAQRLTERSLHISIALEALFSLCWYGMRVLAPALSSITAGSRRHGKTIWPWPKMISTSGLLFILCRKHF